MQRPGMQRPVFFEMRGRTVTDFACQGSCNTGQRPYNFHPVRPYNFHPVRFRGNARADHTGLPLISGFTIFVFKPSVGIPPFTKRIPWKNRAHMPTPDSHRRHALFPPRLTSAPRAREKFSSSNITAPTRRFNPASALEGQSEPRVLTLPFVIRYFMEINDKKMSIRSIR